MIVSSFVTLGNGHLVTGVAMRAQRVYNVARALTRCKWLIYQGFAALFQCDGDVTWWNTLQVEGLVGVNPVQVQVLSPALQSGQGVTVKPDFLP